MRWPAKPKPLYGGLPILENDCSYVWNIPEKERCEWIHNTPDCQVESFVPYPTLLFCTFGTESKPLFASGLLLLFLWLLYLFLILGSTADNFFCPSLSTIATVLRMSDSVAGVTILAFGNGSPDIFTSLVSSESEQLMMFTELIGAGVFVTGIIAGAVALFRPFQVQAKYFLRDATFYMLAACWISYIISDEIVHLWEALTCIGIYLLFIVAVVLMQQAEKQKDHRNKRMPALQDEEVLRAFVENRRAGLAAPPQLPMRSRAFDVQAKLDVAIAREEERNMLIEGGSVSVSVRPSEPTTRPRGLLRGFLYDVNPLNASEWREANCPVKVLLLLRAPFMLPLQLFVPLVNETAEMRGWSRLLNCFQLAVTPVAALCILELWNEKIGPVPLLAVCFACTAPIALLIFVLTSTNRIPKFHNALAFVGFLTAMLVVYAVAQEVMAVLRCVGFASGISDAMLGITLLAWGNSVGDLISNVTIARKGYPRMGFSACFGGPMFNTLLGLGLTLGLTAGRSPGLRTRVRTSDMAYGCLAFLLCSLVSSAVYLTVTGFRARRSYGYLLLTVYGVFMLVNVLSEVHFIHPLGTDHRADEKEEPKAAP